MTDTLSTEIQDLDPAELDDVNGGSVRDFLEGVATGAAIILILL